VQRSQVKATQTKGGALGRLTAGRRHDVVVVTRRRARNIWYGTKPESCDIADSDMIRFAAVPPDRAIALTP
jgi:hypothetical protein